MTTTQKRPGLTFLGFVVTVAPLIGIVVAYHNDAFSGLGWHGGQYAEAFLFGTIGVVSGGAVLRVFAPAPAWRSVGKGMLLAGTVGVLIVVIFMVVVAYAISHMRFV